MAIEPEGYPSQYGRVEGSDNMGVIAEDDITTNKNVPIDVNDNLDDMLEVEDPKQNNVE